MGIIFRKMDKDLIIKDQGLENRLKFDCYYGYK